MDIDIRQLALDALYNRGDEQPETAKSCFIYNKAGAKLRSCSADAIPVLEDLIREIVVPAMDEHREKNGVPDWNSMIQEGTPFAGLSEFIGAYWVICARIDPARATKFMGEMTRPVVNESVSVLSTYFHPANSLADVALPSEYVEFVNCLNDSDVDEFQNVANYAINRLQLKDSAAH